MFAFTVTLARDEGGLDQSDSSGGGKKWLDCGYILKIELTGFVDISAME